MPLALLGVFLITRPSGKSGSDVGGELAGEEFCLPPVSATGSMASETKGDLLTLACAVFFAIHIVALNHYAATERGESAFKTIAILQLAVTGFLSALFCGAAEKPCLHPSPRLGWDVAAAGLLASALAFSVFAWSQKHLTATRSAIICATESLWAALTAFLVNGDVLSGPNLAGAALILAAVTAPDWLPRVVPAWGAEAEKAAAAEGGAAGGEVEMAGAPAPAAGDVEVGGGAKEAEAAPLLQATGAAAEG